MYVCVKNAILILIRLERAVIHRYFVKADV